MLSALAFVLAAQAPIQEPPRLRTILPNGAVVLVERVPNARTVTMALWVSAAGSPESSIRNGLRHLLEHLAAKGARGDLDRKLETSGGFLIANTLRDAMQFQVRVPKEGLPIGLKALRDVTTARQYDSAEIAQEALVMGQEEAIRDASAKFSAAAWDEAYASMAPDPFGDLDVIRLASPESLRKTFAGTFVGPGSAIVVAGDVDLDQATKAASEVVATLPNSPAAVIPRPVGRAGRTVCDAVGEARAAVVGSFREESTAACLMAGLALASEIDGSFFTYTPSAQPGLMIVGRVGEDGVGETIDSVDVAGLYGRGLSLAKRWVQRSLSDPDGICYLRGLLLSQGAGLRPETMLENLDNVSEEQFESAIKRYQRGQAVEVSGR